MAYGIVNVPGCTSAELAEVRTNVETTKALAIVAQSSAACAQDTADTAKSLIESIPRQYISATQPEIWKNLDTWLREVD